MSAIRDPGVQPERTALAWRRTGLTLAAGSLMAVHVLPRVSASPWWVLTGICGLVSALGVLVAADRRYRPLQPGSRSPGPGAAALATALAAGLLAIAALAYVLLH
jgi:putative membrane protein